MRIAICNERFLPRFGVDRFLVLLAQRLVQSGHEVSFACLRCDRSMLEPISSRITETSSPPGLSMLGFEQAALNALVHSWEANLPDAVVIGGWPFFKTAAQARNLGTKSIFIDAGAVAQNGFSDPALNIQLELRRIRQLALPFIDRVLPISQFIRETQSEPDRGRSAGVRTVLLGADHMERGVFGGDDAALGHGKLEKIQELANAGRKLILLLGRFEATGYKNSAAAFELLRKIRDQEPSAHLLILDAGFDCKIPSDLAGHVECLGAPADDSLRQIMSHCVAGVSMSTWEGFNLPLAEMQWIGRPAFAFNIGAHPEVVADPWLLADNSAEMTAKLVVYLKGQAPLDLPSRFFAFRERCLWDKTLSAWEHEISDLVHAPITEVVTDPRNRRIVIVDVTNASLDPANPGVIRVARRLSAELQRHPHLEVVFAGWQNGDYVFLNTRRRQLLEGFGGPKDGLGLLASCGYPFSLREFVAAADMARARQPILLITEVILDGQTSARVQWAKQLGFRVAAILFDLIPVLHPELCGANVSQHFPSYLETLFEIDAVWSISSATLVNFNTYAQHAARVISARSEVIHLPGQLAGHARQNGSGSEIDSTEIRILCVSTLEPRKNHLRLVKAYQNLRQRHPELPLRLVLVGNRYSSAPEIADAVKTASQKDSSIEWSGIIDDSRLKEEFERAAFTVYPSLVEGYGLPILESIWMGRPCLTHNSGVMRELAEGGGCLTTDMNDVNQLTVDIERLATDRELRDRLHSEAIRRPVMTWEEYGSEIADRLANV